MRHLRVLALVAMVLMALPAAAAFAQYPAPLGACSVAANAADFQPNSVATFTVTVQTGNGQPAPGVAGTVTIGSGNGTVQTPTFTSGNDGKATISVLTGANPGNITLNVTCGALQTSSVVRVASPATAPFIPKPPDTGFGSEDSGSSFPMLWVAGALAALALGASSVAYARKRS